MGFSAKAPAGCAAWVAAKLGGDAGRRAARAPSTASAPRPRDRGSSTASPNLRRGPRRSGRPRPARRRIWSGGSRRRSPLPRALAEPPWRSVAGARDHIAAARRSSGRSGGRPLFAAIGLPVNLQRPGDRRCPYAHLAIWRRPELLVGRGRARQSAPCGRPPRRTAHRAARRRQAGALCLDAPPAQGAGSRPDEQVAFRTRLAAPPEGVSDVAGQIRLGRATWLRPKRDGYERRATGRSAV